MIVALCPTVTCISMTRSSASTIEINKCWIVSTGWSAQEPAPRLERAHRRADQFAALLDMPTPPLKELPSTLAAWQSNFSLDGYITAIQRVIGLILAGDVFQANIAQRFTARMQTSFHPISFYCRLRSLNLAPFAAHMRWRDHHCLKFTGTFPQARRTKRRNTPHQGHDSALQ